MAQRVLHVVQGRQQAAGRVPVRGGDVAEHCKVDGHGWVPVTESMAPRAGGKYDHRGITVPGAILRAM